jgi:hypothetical protein
MAADQAELERQHVLLGLKLPARGYYKDIAELREAVDVEKAARAELPALDAERIALGVEVPPGGFPNATLYKAAVVAKRGGLPATTNAPVPKCPPGALHLFPGTPVSMCLLNGVSAGPPKCPSGYVTNVNRRVCDVDPAAAAANDARRAAKDAEEAAIKAAAAAAKLQADTAAASEKAQKEVDRYTISFNAVQTQKNQIQKTAEVMAQATGAFSGVSDDLRYSVNQFDTHLKDLQNQINLTNRKTPAPSWWPWVDIFLNVMIVLVLLYAIYSLVRRTYYVKPVVTQLQYQ